MSPRGWKLSRRAWVGHQGRVICAVPKNVNFHTLGFEDTLHNFKQAADKNRFPMEEKKIGENLVVTRLAQDSKQGD